MKLSTVVLGLSTLVPATFAWTLQTDYSGNNFLNKFTYFSGADPTNGFVQYQSQADAQSKGLAFVRNNRIIIKPDNTTVTPNGRPSVRLESTARYNSGLFLFDLNHMPIGCGTWPAYWMFGDNWPNNGEIDVSYIKNKLIILNNVRILSLIYINLFRLLKVSITKPPMVLLFILRLAVL